MRRLRCGKLARRGRCREREGADQRAVLRDLTGESRLTARINEVDAAAEHRERRFPAAASAPRCAPLSMPCGEAARDCESTFAQDRARIRRPYRWPWWSGVAAADDRELRLAQGRRYCRRRTERSGGPRMRMQQQRGKRGSLKGTQVMARDARASGAPPQSANGPVRPRKASTLAGSAADRRRCAEGSGANEMALAVPEPRSAAASSGRVSPGARVSVTQAYASSLGICRGLSRRRAIKSPAPSTPASLQIYGFSTRYPSRMMFCGFHDQAETHAIEGLEHHVGADALIGQADFRLEPAGTPAKKPCFSSSTTTCAGHRRRKHIAGHETVARTAVDGDHLILTDDGDPVRNRDEPPIDLGARRARREVERHIDAAREHLVAGFGSRWNRS